MKIRFKDIYELTCVLGGFVLALYVGIWVCFIGGLVDIANGFKATPVLPLSVLFGIFKIMIASPIGWAIFIIGLTLGECYGKKLY